MNSGSGFRYFWWKTLSPLFLIPLLPKLKINVFFEVKKGKVELCKNNIDFV